MFLASEIAKYIISYAHTKGSVVTNLKLQKILYYVQGYCLKEFEEPAFEEEIINWPYGPVVRDVYFEYCSFISNPLHVNGSEDEAIEVISQNRNKVKILNKVIDCCLEKTAAQLVEQTHIEDPWKNTKKGDVISVNRIQIYFADNDPLELYAKHG